VCYFLAACVTEEGNNITRGKSIIGTSYVKILPNSFELKKNEKCCGVAGHVVEMGW
jgi:hypothetical protein